MARKQVDQWIKIYGPVSTPTASSGDWQIWPHMQRKARRRARQVHIRFLHMCSKCNQGLLMSPNEDLDLSGPLDEADG